MHRLKELSYAKFYYQPGYIPDPDALFARILEDTPWEQGQVVVYGKVFDEPRQTYMLSTDPSKEYVYSGRKVTTHAFPPYLEELRKALCELTGEEYDSCLMILYVDGSSKIGMHADKEKSLVPGASIASISLGAVRAFDVWTKPLGKQYSEEYTPNHGQDEVIKHRFHLENGSLLIMGKDSQRNYVHGVPAQKRIKEPRINLTFRRTK